MQRRSVWDYSIEAAKSISQRGTDLYMLSLEVLQFLNSPGQKVFLKLRENSRMRCFKLQFHVN